MRPKSLRCWRSICCVALTLLIVAPLGAAELPALDPAAAAKTSFRRDVWPILKRDCWGCHAGANAKGGLNLDSVPKMIAGGDSGSALTPGKPDESLLVTMLVGEKPEMPKNKPP